MERAELWYRAEGGYRLQGAVVRVRGMGGMVLRGQKYDFLSYGIIDELAMRL